MSYIFGPSPGSFAAHIQLPDAWRACDARGKRGKTRRKNSADIFFLVLPSPSCLGFAWKRCLRKKGPKKKERTQNGGALIVVNTACRKIRKNQLQEI